MMKNAQQSGKRDVRAVVFLAFLILIGSLSCSTKMPAIYTEQGGVRSITDYEKMAQKEYDEGRYDNAIAVYTAILRHYPFNVEAVTWADYEIGYCHYRLKEYAQAKVYFRTVANEHQDPAARTLALQMLDRIGEIEKKGKKRRKEE
jgi:outer membrane protein assembly factor BamD (BamD/ComL family)